MKKIYSTSLAVIGVTMVLALSSCMLNCVHGSGHEVSETRHISDFSQISISGDYKVILKQDSSLSLKITGDDNLLRYIKTNVDGDRLHIDSKRNFCNTGQIVVNLGVKNLDEIKASGAVEVESDGRLHTRDLHLELSGATKITMDLNAANVTTSGRGATELNLKGQATSHQVDISGVAHLYALDFVVGSYDIHTTGAGNCDVNVLNSLSVHSTGASEVRYRGNPSSVTNDKSGASSVEKIN